MYRMSVPYAQKDPRFLFVKKRGQPREFWSLVSTIDGSTLPQDCVEEQLFAEHEVTGEKYNTNHSKSSVQTVTVLGPAVGVVNRGRANVETFKLTESDLRFESEKMGKKEGLLPPPPPSPCHPLNSTHLI